MANIMMTDSCNLCCPYCFANEFVNKDKNEITEENFDKAVNFILGDGSHDSIGLIGGEPLLHSQFEYLLKKLINNDKVKRVTIYTNGLYLNHFYDIISNRKNYLLINCNSPEDMGFSRYDRLVENVDYLINKRLMNEQITLGVNIFKPDFNYGFMLDLLKKYKLRHVRVSITVPNFSENRNSDAHMYFNSMKPVIFSFFHDLLKNGIIPNFDCNKIPSCLITQDELNAFQIYRNSDFISKNIFRSNITNPLVRCMPVIDIRQDLTAVRCFGLSEYTKTNINNFRSIHDLENFYIRTVDAYAFNTSYSPKCVDCNSRKVLECMGGCLAFKIDKIMELQNFAAKLLNNIDR